MARMVLLDWQRGRLPYFSLPPLPEVRGRAVLSPKKTNAEQYQGTCVLCEESRGLHGSAASSSGRLPCFHLPILLLISVTGCLRCCANIYHVIRHKAPSHQEMLTVTVSCRATALDQPA